MTMTQKIHKLSLACKLSAHPHVVKHGGEFRLEVDLTGQLGASIEACHNIKMCKSECLHPNHWELGFKLGTSKSVFLIYSPKQ